MHRHVAYVFLVLLVSALTRARGQTDSAATVARGDVGQRVRVRSASGAVVGVLRDVRADSLFADVGSGTSELRTMSIASLTSLEARERLTSSRRVQRGLVGLAAGALLGAGVGFALAVPAVHRIENRPNHDGPFEQLDYLTFPVVGGLLGGGFGYAVGYERSEVWVLRFAVVR